MFVEQAVSSAVLQPLLPFFFMRQEVVVEFAVFGADGVIVPPPASILQIRGDLPQAQAGGLSLVDARMIFGGPIQAPLWGLPPLCGRKEAYSWGCLGCLKGVCR